MQNTHKYWLYDSLHCLNQYHWWILFHRAYCMLCFFTFKRYVLKKRGKVNLPWRTAGDLTALAAVLIYTQQKAVFIHWRLQTQTPTKLPASVHWTICSPTDSFSLLHPAALSWRYICVLFPAYEGCLSILHLRLQNLTQHVHNMQ